MEGLRVKIFRRYEQVLAKHVASLTPSVPGFKKVVADFEFGAGRLGKKVTLGPESWTYVLLADERLFELSGLCWNNWEAALLERTFDAMAKSLTLSVPVDGRGTPGTYRTYEGASFSFEYPADWTVAGSYDDDENIGAGVDKSLYIHAPYDPEQPTVNKRTYIGCSQYPLQPNDKATIDDYVREGKHGLSLIEGETSFGYEAFETRLGQKGIKHWYVVKIPPNHETNFVAFALPTRLGRLQILGFWYDADQRDALEPVFEHVGRSLVVK